MNQDKYVFAQLAAFLSRTQFNNFVRKFDGNRYVKQFTCRNQQLAMMFWQLNNRVSLCDLIVAFEAHRAKQFHLGLGRNPIAKATLAYANQNRDYRIFEDFAFYMMKKPARSGRPTSLTFPERNMRLVQQRFRYVLHHSHGRSSEERKEASKLMSYMTLKHKFQPSIL